MHKNRINQYPRRYLRWFALAVVFLIIQFMGGCSTEQPVISHDGFAISKIRIKDNGATSNLRPDMTDTCKGFLLSKKQVLNFFIYANRVKDSSTGENSDILPCYVSGIATIDNNPYTWTIRSGGIGEFTNKRKKIVKVCGKNCCLKVPGVC